MSRIKELIRQRNELNKEIEGLQGEGAELKKKVRDVLLDKWDPIGIIQLGGPTDEYDSYIPEIIRQLRSDYNVFRIAGHLAELREGMGLRGNNEEDLRIAEILKGLSGMAMEEIRSFVGTKE